MERKQAPDMSRVLWIPTIWMLVISSKGLAIWFKIEGDPNTGSQIDRMFFSGLLCLGLLILVLKKLDWSDVIKKNRWLFLLIGYMLVSVLWSDIPFVSFKRWIRELAAVVMALLVLTEEDPRQALLSLFRRTIYTLIPFSFLLIKYFRSYGVEYNRWSGALSWIGVTTQKNGLGRLCLISAFFLIWAIIRRRQGNDIAVFKYQNHLDVFLLLLTFYLMKGVDIRAMSATAVGSFVVGLFIFISLLWMKRHGTKLEQVPFVTILIFVIVFGTFTLFAGGTNIGDFASFFGRSGTLTGRTGVWADLLPIAMQKPIVGSGFGGFWTPSTRWQYDISEGHSGYLDVLLEQGFVGLFLLSMFLLSSCRRARKELNNNFDWASLWICYLIMSAVHNITESSFNDLASQLPAVILFMAISSSKAILDTQKKV